MRVKVFVLYLCLFAVSFSYAAEKPVEIVVLVASYNNGASNRNACIKNLESIDQQTYPFELYYVNDCSSDDTKELVDGFIAKSRWLKDHSTVIHNTTRKKALRNIYEAVHKIAPHKVVVSVDGDDYLAHENVLAKIAAVYKKSNVWLTWGNLRCIPYRPSWGGHYSPDVMRSRSFRKQPWKCPQPRTFYAKLFQQIKKEDLMYKGSFFPSAGDLAYMFPLLEMASDGHARFINEVLYMYYMDTPLNDFRAHGREQQEMDRYIRRKQPYEPLVSLFDEER